MSILIVAAGTVSAGVVLGLSLYALLETVRRWRRRSRRDLATARPSTPDAGH